MEHKKNIKQPAKKDLFHLAKSLALLVEKMDVEAGKKKQIQKKP